MRNLTPNFCFRLDDLKRRIVALRNDLRSFKLEQKGKLSFVSYLILSPKPQTINNAYFIIKPKNRENNHLRSPTMHIASSA